MKVVTAATGPPAPSAVICGTSRFTSVPPNWIVYCVPPPNPADVTTTLPPTPPMLGRFFSAV